MKKILLFVGLIIILLAAFWLWRGQATKNGDATAVRARHEADLMAVPGVVGVGTGTCGEKECIKVLLEKETAQSKQIPKELEGVTVETEVTGAIEAY